MGARQQLNRTHINGALGLAVIAGWLTGSWTVFVVTGAVFLGLSLYAGEIRFARRHRRQASAVDGGRPRWSEAQRTSQTTEREGRKHEQAS